MNFDHFRIFKIVQQFFSSASMGPFKQRGGRSTPHYVLISTNTVTPSMSPRTAFFFRFLKQDCRTKKLKFYSTLLFAYQLQPAMLYDNMGQDLRSCKYLFVLIVSVVMAAIRLHINRGIHLKLSSILIDAVASCQIKVLSFFSFFLPFDRLLWYLQQSGLS